MSMKVRFLAAKTVLTASLFAFGITNTANAGIPVIDASNLQQNVMNTVESIAQTLKQIEEYRTQLQQYENQLQNTLAPAAYIWDQAQTTINGLMNAVNTLDYYRNQFGSVDNYLSKFQDVSYYRSSPCFKLGGQCTPAERALLEENKSLASESQKKANDALMQGLRRQQDNLKSDARQLEDLQRKAQGARGQMEAIGYANQIASQQSNQLLQIRGLLIAQQNAIGSQLQVQLDKEARQQVIAEKVRKNSYQQSPQKAW